ncbi:ADP-ribosylglycohydrolase family protein [endosymbiont 'TC1' of Trimyema compressum]|nr:ADP-ribosylglycohydrolase family protein [endosymbiont 'TC1' of Trimyema compressum]
MRTLPVPLFYDDFKEMLFVAGEQSYLTHFDPRCREACQLYY